MHVYLLATLDSKGAEAEYLRGQLLRLGVAVRLVDVGCQGEPQVPADISRAELFAASGDSPASLVALSDRGSAISAASRAAEAFLRAEHAAGRVAGVLSLGGSAGTTIGTAAMRALPLGIPKLMVSTLASGQVAHYVGESDICMLPSVVDLAGLNRIIRPILDNAARAMAGMVGFPREEFQGADRPLLAATMFGVTTPCVQHARQVLEAAGYEVLVFHATGNGGRTLERLIREGHIVGVLDITTTELADELVGGVLSAGPERLTAARDLKIPQVVSVGATDMVNFHARGSVPAEFAGRLFHQHNASVTLMRTTVDENRRIGADLGGKLAASPESTCVLLPTLGVSALDQAGQPFNDPAARQALFEEIRAHAGTVTVRELDLHINDQAFAQAAAEELLRRLRVAAPPVPGAGG